MKKSLLIVFLLLVIAPLGVITWLSYSNIVREESMSEERYAILAKRQLEEVDRLLQSHLRKLELELQEYRNIQDLNADELRRITRNARIVEQLFVINDERAFVFPPELGETSAHEREFLEAAGDLELPLVLGSNTVESTGRDSGEQGWYTWFMGEGVNFLYWQTGENGYRTGVVLERIALISSIVAVLPDSDFTATDDRTPRITITTTSSTSE